MDGAPSFHSLEFYGSQSHPDAGGGRIFEKKF
jgi:hypothetical protein